VGFNSAFKGLNMKVVCINVNLFLHSCETFSLNNCKPNIRVVYTFAQCIGITCRVLGEANASPIFFLLKNSCLATELKTGK